MLSEHSPTGAHDPSVTTTPFEAFLSRGKRLDFIGSFAASYADNAFGLSFGPRALTISPYFPSAIGTTIAHHGLVRTALYMTQRLEKGNIPADLPAALRAANAAVIYAANAAYAAKAKSDTTAQYMTGALARVNEVPPSERLRTLTQLTQARFILPLTKVTDAKVTPADQAVVADLRKSLLSATSGNVSEAYNALSLGLVGIRDPRAALTNIKGSEAALGETYARTLGFLSASLRSLPTHAEIGSEIVALVAQRVSSTPEKAETISRVLGTMYATGAAEDPHGILDRFASLNSVPPSMYLPFQVTRSISRQDTAGTEDLLHQVAAADSRVWIAAQAMITAENYPSTQAAILVREEFKKALSAIKPNDWNALFYGATVVARQLALNGKDASADLFATLPKPDSLLAAPLDPQTSYNHIRALWALGQAHALAEQFNDAYRLFYRGIEYFCLQSAQFQMENVELLRFGSTAAALGGLVSMVQTFTHIELNIAYTLPSNSNYDALAAHAAHSAHIATAGYSHSRILALADEKDYKNTPEVLPELH